MRIRTGPIIAAAILATVWIFGPAVLAAFSRRAAIASLISLAVLVTAASITTMVVASIVTRGKRMTMPELEPEPNPYRRRRNRSRNPEGIRTV